MNGLALNFWKMHFYSTPTFTGLRALLIHPQGVHNQ